MEKFVCQYCECPNGVELEYCQDQEKRYLEMKKKYMECLEFYGKVLEEKRRFIKDIFGGSYTQKKVGKFVLEKLPELFEMTSKAFLENPEIVGRLFISGDLLKAIKTHEWNYKYTCKFCGGETKSWIQK